jgi:hypothetical protein
MAALEPEQAPGQEMPAWLYSYYTSFFSGMTGSPIKVEQDAAPEVV